MIVTNITLNVSGIGHTQSCSHGYKLFSTKMFSKMLIDYHWRNFRDKSMAIDFREEIWYLHPLT